MKNHFHYAFISLLMVVFLEDCNFKEPNRNNEDTKIEVIKNKLLHTKEILSRFSNDELIQITKSDWIRKNIDTTWKRTYRKISITFYDDLTLTDFGVSPFFVIEYNSNLFTFIPKRNNTISFNIDSVFFYKLEAFEHISDFLNKTGYLDDPSISKEEKLKFITDFFLLAKVQSFYLKYNSDHYLPKKYFLNKRNIITIKDIKQLDKLIELSLFKNKVYKPILATKKDGLKDTINGIEYQRQQDELFVQKYHDRILSYQKKMVLAIQNKRNEIINQLNCGNTYMYLSIPDMNLHLVKVYKYKGTYNVIGVIVNDHVTSYNPIDQWNAGVQFIHY